MTSSVTFGSQHGASGAVWGALDLWRIGRRWMLATIAALLLVLALATNAQPPIGDTPPPAGGPKFTFNLPAQPPPPEYPLPARHGVRQWSPTGLSLSATAHGRSMDLTKWNGWSVDPEARPDEAEAGLTWHGAKASTTFGYVQPSFGGPDATYPHSFRPQGLVGFSLSVHPKK
jgi:hypothetical protein